MRQQEFGPWTVRMVSLAVVLLPTCLAEAQSRVAGNGDTIDGRVIASINNNAALDDAGNIVFDALYYENGRQCSGVFSPSRLLFQAGDVVDGLTLVQSVDSPAMSSSGSLVFRGTAQSWGPRTGWYGIFSPTKSLVKPGDIVAGMTVKNIGNGSLAVNDQGQVSYLAIFEDNTRGICVYDGASNTNTLIARDGDIIDGWAVGGFMGTSINFLGEVVFHAWGVSSDSYVETIFDRFHMLIAPGDPGYPGGLPGLNDKGDIVFDGYTADEEWGVFCNDSLLVRRGDTVDNRVLEALVFPKINNRRDVVFVGVSRNQDGTYARDVFFMHVNSLPIADAGPDQTIAATSELTQVHLDASGSNDPDNDTLTYEWSVPQGSGAVLDDPSSKTPRGLFPVGPTLVTLTVADGKGGVATGDVLITVEDGTPPVVVCTTDKAMLWPPDHRIESIKVYVQASDNVVNEGQLNITANVRSSEADDAKGDGRYPGDVNGVDAYNQAVPFDLTFDRTLGCFVGTLCLRAERDGSQASRAYSIVTDVADLAGNHTAASCVVVVPHDRRKN